MMAEENATVFHKKADNCLLLSTVTPENIMYFEE